MKRLIVTFIFIISFFNLKAQETESKQSIFGLQLEWLGLTAYHEGKLNEKFSLRSEIGYNATLFGGTFYGGNFFVLTPELTLQPRFYYNMAKRQGKGKSIESNSGNFVAFSASYRPDRFIISDYEDISAVSNLSYTPMWGMRRKLGKVLEFETGIGVTYWYFFSKNAGFSENETDLSLHLHLRIGISLN